jgi:hypothetical protein
MYIGTVLFNLTLALTEEWTPVHAYLYLDLSVNFVHIYGCVYLCI